MDNPIQKYWQYRLQSLKERLQKNNFEAHIAGDLNEATELILNKIIPESKPATVSYAGSMTLQSTSILESIDNLPEISLLRTDAPDISVEEKIERRRQALLVDLFITGTNAITEDGQLVNLDMIGNRTGAINFGPKKVILLIGRNKIVPDLEAAMYRIKDYAAPANAMRLEFKTPCVKTSECAECSSPSRICNTWCITEKSFPKNRIAVILIDQELGL